MSCKFIWYNLPKQIKDKLGINDGKGWSNIPKRVNNLLDTLKTDKPTCYSTLFPKGHNIIWHDLPNRLEKVCELVNCEEPSLINFDVTADWGVNAVFDKQSFIDFLLGQGASLVDISEFKLENNRLQANINVEGQPEFNIFIAYRVEKIGGFDSNLNKLTISGNDINGVGISYINPEIVLPQNLITLSIQQSETLTIVDFTIPPTLSDIILGQNLISTVLIDFTQSSSLASISLAINKLTSFTNQLPENLAFLDLSDNLLTTDSYISMEEWATNLPTFTSECQMLFTGNIDSITGTDLETILLTKNVVITP